MSHDDWAYLKKEKNDNNTVVLLYKEKQLIRCIFYYDRIDVRRKTRKTI